MKKVVQITKLARRNNSVYGNPRWHAYLSDGTSYMTQADASCGYGLDNSENLPPNRVEVTVESGLITYVEPITQPAVVEHRRKARTSQQNAARRIAAKQVDWETDAALDDCVYWPRLDTECAGPRVDMQPDGVCICEKHFNSPPK